MALARSRRFWLLLGAFVLAVVIPLGLAGIVSLPGVDLRTRLGLVDTPEFPPILPCTPARHHWRVPKPAAPSGAAWRPERPSPLKRLELKAAVSDGKIYLANGQANRGVSQKSVLAFDPDTGRYSSLPGTPRGVDHALFAAHRGDLYVVGGYFQSHPTGQAWHYSPKTRRWTRMPPLRVARGGLDGAVIGHKLYAVGGAPQTYPSVNAGPYGSLDIYDLDTGRWSSGPDMPTPRHHIGATALDGKLYVIGGRKPFDSSLDTVERFDPGTGRWDKLPPLPQGISDFQAVTANGKVVVTGGDDEQNVDDGGGWVTPATWSFDPRTNRWSRLPDMRIARHGHGAAVAAGRIWAFEGGACPGASWSHSVESLSVRGAGL